MDLEETKFALQELQSRYDFQTEELAALRQQLAQAQAACAALEQEEVRRIRHLNRLGTWAQQDPTGPMIADQIQQWVLAELKAALGSAYEATSWQPETMLANEGWLSPDEASLLKEQTRVSDEAFNFHLKRASDLMEKCNELEDEAKRLEAELKDAKRLAAYKDETATTFMNQVKKLQAEMAQLQELHLMQLSGIMTASIQNTESTVKDRIDRTNPYWTQAYEDVCRAINREMAHRNESTRLEAQCAAMRQRLEELLQVCDLIDDETGHQTKATQQALSTTAGQELLQRLERYYSLLKELDLGVLAIDKPDFCKRVREALKGDAK